MPPCHILCRHAHVCATMTCLSRHAKPVPLCHAWTTPCRTLPHVSSSAARFFSSSSPITPSILSRSRRTWGVEGGVGCRGLCAGGFEGREWSAREVGRRWVS